MPWRWIRSASVAGMHLCPMRSSDRAESEIQLHSRSELPPVLFAGIRLQAVLQSPVRAPKPTPNQAYFPDHMVKNALKCGKVVFEMDRARSLATTTCRLVRKRKFPNISDS